LLSLPAGRQGGDLRRGLVFNIFSLYKNKRTGSLTQVTLRRDIDMDIFSLGLPFPCRYCNEWPRKTCASDFLARGIGCKKFPRPKEPPKVKKFRRLDYQKAMESQALY